MTDEKNRSSGKILAVEDAPAVQMVLRFYLEEAGYRVVETATGPEAIKWCDNYKERVDLVILDVELPGMSGPEALREIRKNRPDVPVIYMSAHDSKWLTGRRRIPPEVRLLQKPFCSDVLVAHRQHKPAFSECARA